MKYGSFRVKGIWCGNGRSGRLARRNMLKAVKRSAKRRLAKEAKDEQFI